MTDLREQLAKKLWEAASCCKWESGKPFPSGGWPLRAADECIRQMKWTYHACRWASPETMSWNETLLEDGDMNTGLAPDGWSTTTPGEPNG